MAVSTLRKCAKRSRISAVRWRTYWKNPDDTYRFEREELLVDDPKNGIYDLTKWKRKYASFDGKYISRRSRPDNYPPQPPPMTKAEFVARAHEKYGKYILLTDEQFNEVEAIYQKFEQRVFIPLVADLIAAGTLSPEFKLDALDAAHYGMHLARVCYDPTHAPNKHEGIPEDALTPASLETYLIVCGRNAMRNFVEWTHTEKAGGWLIKQPISNASKAAAEEKGEISVEVLPVEARYNIGMVDICLDCATIRKLILKIHGSLFLDIFDKRLNEENDVDIYTPLKVSPGVFRTQYLRPIQDLVNCYWLEPNIPRREWK